MINPLEQLPPLQTIVFICKQDGIINDSEIVGINQEFCCPFCCNPVEIEFEEFLLKEGYRAPDSHSENHAACSVAEPPSQMLGYLSDRDLDYEDWLFS